MISLHIIYKTIWETFFKSSPIRVVYMYATLLSRYVLAAVTNNFPLNLWRTRRGQQVLHSVSVNELLPLSSCSSKSYDNIEVFIWHIIIVYDIQLDKNALCTFFCDLHSHWIPPVTTNNGKSSWLKTIIMGQEDDLCAS